MIVTVTPNPALDVTYAVDSFPVGEVLRVDAPVVRAGGKGVNVARVLVQQGEQVRAVAPLGGAAGSEFAADLEAAGVPLVAVAVAGELRRSIAIVDRGTDRTTVMNERGAALSAAEADAVLDAAVADSAHADVLVVSGSLPPAFPAGHLGRLVTAAHRAGIPVIADVVGAALNAACAAGADVVKPNQHELLATTGESDPVAGARALLVAGARLVVVTLGAEGMLAISAEDPARVVRGRLPEPISGNPTGAGDAAVAALAHGIRRGERDLAALVRAAVSWSAAAVAHPLAGSLAPGCEELAAHALIEETR